MEYASLVKNELAKVDFRQENSEYQFIDSVLSRPNNNNTPTRPASKKKGKTIQSPQHARKKSKLKEKIIQKFECHRCGKLCLNKEDLIDHFKIHDAEIHKCAKCERAFASKSSLAYHMKSHAGIQYECDICNRKFNDKSNMKKHRNIHLGSQKYKCTICFKGFSDPTNFKNHQNQHKGTRYKCEICLESWSSKQGLKKHIQLKHFGTKKNFPCKNCSASFTLNLSLMEHRNKEHLNVKFVCDLCQKVFYTKEELRSHIITHPGMHLKCSTCQQDFTQYWKYMRHISTHSNYLPCPHCPKQVKGHHALTEHIRNFHREHKCNRCGELFPTKNALKAHWAVHKNGNTKTARYVRKIKNTTLTNYECHDCGRIYARRDILYNHIKREHLHFLPNRLSCDLCKFATYSKSKFRKHRIEHPIVQYLCKSCPSKFDDNDSFKDHLGNHFGNSARPQNNNYWKKHVKEFIFLKHNFKCNICDESFSSLNGVKGLKVHLNTHGGIKYSCHYCEKEYRFKKSLKSHLEIHDGLAYQCVTCNRRFNILSNLRRHLRGKICRRVIRVKFECDLCQKVFYTKEELRSHIITHPGMHLKCSTCQQDFTQYWRYMRHISTHSNYLPCPHCPKQVKGLHALTEHIRNFHREHKCNLCGELFPTKNALKAHWAVHKNGNTKTARYVRKIKNTTLTNYECHDCGRIYASRYTLYNHIKREHLHFLPNRLSCDLCKFATYSKSKFRKHRIEHPIVQYLCKSCPSKFDDNDSFKDHLSNHFGNSARPQNNNYWKKHVKEFIFLKHNFKCNICDESFSSLNGVKGLKVHLNTHGGIKYSCHYCEKEYRFKVSLKRHLEIHDGLAYQCVCDKQFNLLSNLRRHLREKKCRHSRRKQ